MALHNTTEGGTSVSQRALPRKKVKRKKPLLASSESTFPRPPQGTPVAKSRIPGNLLLWLSPLVRGIVLGERSLPHTLRLGTELPSCRSSAKRGAATVVARARNVWCGVYFLCQSVWLWSYCVVHPCPTPVGSLPGQLQRAFKTSTAMPVVLTSDEENRLCVSSTIFIVACGFLSFGVYSITA